MASLYRQLCHTMAYADNNLRNIVVCANGGNIPKKELAFKKNIIKQKVNIAEQELEHFNKLEKNLNNNDSNKLPRKVKSKQIGGEITNGKKDSNEYIPAYKYNYRIEEQPVAVLKPYNPPLRYYFNDGHGYHRLAGAYSEFNDFQHRLGDKLNEKVMQPLEKGFNDTVDRINYRFNEKIRQPIEKGLNKLDSTFIQPIKDKLNELDVEGEEYLKQRELIKKNAPYFNF